MRGDKPGSSWRIKAVALARSTRVPASHSNRRTHLEQQNRYLAQVEVDEVLRFMGHVGSEVPANHAVPSGAVLFVKLLLDICNVETVDKSIAPTDAAGEHSSSEGGGLDTPRYHDTRQSVADVHPLEVTTCPHTLINHCDGHSQAAMSFSMLNFSIAWAAQSIASCCMSSDMSAFLITAFLSAILFGCFIYYNKQTKLARVLGQPGQFLSSHHSVPGLPADRTSRFGALSS